MKFGISCRILCACLTFAAMVTSVWAQEAKPVAVITAKSIATAAEKLPAMAEASGDAASGIALMMFQTYVTQDVFKDAVDVQRPVGLFLFAAEEKPLPVLLVPVKDLESAAKLLPPDVEAVADGENQWKVAKKSDEEGKTEDDAEVEMYASVISFGEWCAVIPKDVTLPENFSAPKMAELLEAETADRDFGVTFFVNEVSEKDRENAFNEIFGKLNCALDKHADCMGAPMNEFFKTELEKLAESAKEHHFESPVSAIRLGYTWNADAKELVISYQFVGSFENEQVCNLSRAARGSETPLANFGVDAMLSIQCNATIPEMNDPVVDSLLDMRSDVCRQHLIAKIGEEKAKPILDFFEKNKSLFRAAAFNSVLEGATAVYAGKDGLTVACARVVPDGYALEKEFQTAVKFIGEKKKDKIDAHVKDAVRVEDGEFHIFQANFIPEKDLPKELQGLFKDGIPGSIIFAPKAVYYAAGTNATEVLLGIVKSETYKPAEKPVFSARVSLQNVLDVVAACGKITEQQRADFAKCGDADVTMCVLSLKNGVEFRSVIPAPAFKVLVKARDLAK